MTWQAGSLARGPWETHFPHLCWVGAVRFSGCGWQMCCCGGKFKQGCVGLSSVLVTSGTGTVTAMQCHIGLDVLGDTEVNA